MKQVITYELKNIKISKIIVLVILIFDYFKTTFCLKTHIFVKVTNSNFHKNSELNCYPDTNILTGNFIY